MKDGKRLRCGYGPKGYPPGGMGGVTGIPHAIGLGMILDSTITEKGLFALEGVIDSMEFLRRCSKYWTEPPEDGELLLEWVEELD